MTLFNKISILSILLFTTGFLSAQNCPDFAQNNLFRTTENCLDGIVECLPIDFEFSEDYEYTLNGDNFNGEISPCGVSNIVGYDVLGIGNYPVNIDSWEVNGSVFNSIVAGSPGALADTMSMLSGANWTFDADDFKIETTEAPDSLGWLVLTEINSGLTAEILPEFSTAGSNTAFEFPIGNHVFVAYNFIEDCADTLLIEVVCQQVTDTLTFNIEEGELDSLVFDNSNLGMINYFANECENQSGTAVEFDLVQGSNLLFYTGFAPGTEQACIVFCDVNGNCDTTYVFVTVTEIADCENPFINSVNIIDETCEEPGSIQLFLEDQNLEYEYFWSNNLPNADLQDDLTAGSYTVTITYADSTQQSCLTVANYTVAFADSLENYTFNVTPACEGNGTATFSNPGLTYTWDDGFQGVERFDLAMGTYEVTVSKGSCENIELVIIPESTIDITGTVNNVCDSLGAIFIEVEGGVPPYSYFWNDGVTTADRFDLDVGDYIIAVTDAEGCMFEMSFPVIDDCPSGNCTQPVITNAELVNPTCEETGSIALELLGNSVEYDFDWSHNGPNSPVQTDLWAGEFNVTITNTDPTTGEVCSTTAEYILTQTDTLDFTLLSTMNATCVEPGAAEFSNNNYMYLWSDDVTGRVRNDLAPGDYTVLVVTANGNCEEEFFLTIAEDVGININANVSNVCDTLGSIYMNVLGNFPPFTYEWSNGVNTQSQPELDEGFYSVTVTDANGCTATDGFDIVDDCPGQGCDEPVIINVVTVNPTCTEGGSIDFEIETPSPDLTYEWSNGGSEIMQIDLPAGNYSVTVTETDPATGNPCITTASFLLTQADSLGFFLVSSTPAGCDIVGSAEYSDSTLLYNWSDGGFGHIRNDLMAGTYTITVTNEQGECPELTSLNIVDISGATEVFEVVSNVCDTLGSIYLSLNGGTGPYTVNWSNGTTTQNQPALDVGVYTVSVTDNQGCLIVETYEIIDDCSGSGCEAPILVATEIQDPNCTNPGNIFLEVENFNENTSFDWSDGGSDDNIRVELSAGDYQVTITNTDPNTGETCFITASFNLVLSDTLDYFLVSTTPAGCVGAGSAEFSNPTLIYTWSDGGFGYTRDDLSPGSYTVTVSNSDDSCVEISNFTINSTNAIDASVLVSNVCDTLGSIYLSVVGGTAPYTYDWSDLPGNSNQQDRQTIDVGSYTLTIIDNDGCTLTLDFNIVDDCPSTGDLFFSFVPDDLDIECGDTAPIDNPVAESICPGDITYDFTETQSPSCGNTNNITRTWIATDDCGNTASAQQFIFEQDVEVPEIVTVGNITIDLLNGDSLPNPFDLAFAEDECGTVDDLTFTKQESITDDGYEVAYEWTAIDGCGNLSTELHTLNITGGMIWPGDTDSNKVVNNFDVFNIGFAYGETGSSRINPTLDFLPQYAAPWSGSALDSVNFRHADTDGNGIVDEQDILAVNQNYDLVHNLQEAGDTRESFDINFVYETVTADNWVHVAITLGDNAEPIDDFYGAGFIIEYDQDMVVENTAHVDFSESWTGTFFDDFIALQKDFYDEGRLDIGLVRTNQQGIDGSGKIGSFRFQLPEGVDFTPFTLTARQGSGVRADKSPYELETTEVIVTNTKEFLPASAITVYPNPATTELFLTIPTELEVTDIQLLGTNGQVVRQFADVTANKMEVGDLPTGLYYLRILTNEGVWADKVSIIK